MPRRVEFADFPLTALFSRIERGDFHATHELEDGDIPLVSCAEANCGVEGFYDIPEDKTYERVVTISSGGLPLTAFYHPYRIGVKDDDMICTPRDGIGEATLRYAIVLLNRMRWRFSFGRKCYSNKIGSVRIRLPATAAGDIDHAAIRRSFPLPSINSVIPPRNRCGVAAPISHWMDFHLTSLFELERGDFHSLASLEPGGTWVVSRTATDNGTVGRKAPPDGARVFPPGILTVSTVSGDAFLQFDHFIATDNVIACIPKEELKWTTLLFIVFAWNRTRWRASYARQFYRKKLSEQTVRLPVDKLGALDEEAMVKATESVPYFDALSRQASFDIPTVDTLPFRVGKAKESVEP